MDSAAAEAEFVRLFAGARRIRTSGPEQPGVALMLHIAQAVTLKRKPTSSPKNEKLDRYSGARSHEAQRAY